jgi:hypothetical protein
MRSRILLIAAAVLSASSVYAELTVEQKVVDFTYLTGLYARNYAPWEWKRDVMGFDLFDIKPWMDRVKASKSDLEYYDICARYVAGLQDAHAWFALLSDFVAHLPINADIYDGKVLIDGVARTMLPSDEYPFAIGDELVSVDGRPVADLIDEYRPFTAGGGNPAAWRRMAARIITFRRQNLYPRAPDVGNTATIVVRNSSGNESSYVLPWIKSGTPVWTAGVVASPQSAPGGRLPHPQRDEKRAREAWGLWFEDPQPSNAKAVPSYLKALHQLQVPEGIAGAVQWGSLLPMFDPPPGFQIRVGTRLNDEFLSGTFPAGDFRIGFIRIPSMGNSDSPVGPQQFASEIAFMQANTDGLVIDVMSNGGGSNCYAEDITRYLMTKPFRGVASRLRATQEWIYYFSSSLYSAKQSNAPQEVIDLYSGYLAQIQAALNQNRGMTGPLPICTPDFERIDPAAVTYTKPIVILVNELSGSAAENLPMFMQDEGRGTVVGMRTLGAGGAPAKFPAGAFSGGSTSVTMSIVTRSRTVSTPGFPAADQIENVGVYPDVISDIMSRENLLTAGRPFVEKFSSVITELIRRQSVLNEKPK